MRAEEAVRAKLRDEISSKEATTDEFRQVSQYTLIHYVLVLYVLSTNLMIDKH